MKILLTAVTDHPNPNIRKNLFDWGITTFSKDPSKPQCFKSKDTSVLSGGFVSPSQFRQPVKAIPSGSLIVANTTVKENIRLRRKLRKENQNKLNKKTVRKR